MTDLATNLYAEAMSILRKTEPNQARQISNVRKKMKTSLRNNFEDFERVSMFPYVWLRTLAYWVFVAACGSAVYFLMPTGDSRMRNAASFGAIFSGCILMLIFQHCFATFSCRRCGHKMDKYRDPDKSRLIFYYACNECRIYWKNNASAGPK